MAQVEPWTRQEAGVMSARRLAVVCGTVVLAGWVAGGLARFGSSGIDDTGAPTEDSRATSVNGDAEPVDAPQATTMDGHSRAHAAIVDAALPGPRPMLPPESQHVLVAAASTPDPLQDHTKEAVSSVETLDECFVLEICVDQYLWSVYQRAPKVDTIKVRDHIKVTVKKKRKTRTIIKTITKLVDEDSTWKDPKAAQKAGMSLMEYVIGGMDRRFKLKLYHALRALDDAGLSPGITSGFRDDYRQSLASGTKAASESSSHHARTDGGSLRLEAGLSYRRQRLRFGREPGVAGQTEEDHTAHSRLRQVHPDGRDVFARRLHF